MSMLKTIPDYPTPVLMDQTPFMGGGGLGGGVDGRNVIVELSDAPDGGTILQGHDAIDQPATGDAGWYTLLAPSATSQLKHEVNLPRWVRRGNGWPGTITLHGVQ